MESTTPPPRPLDWSRAGRALRLLVEDPQRTDQVFEIIEALAGNSFEPHYRRFVESDEGRRMLADRPSLLAVLSDRAALLALPEGSFGRAYAEFMQAGGLTAEGLVEADATAARNNPAEPMLDPDRVYVGDRLRDMHDLWHVLTGYGMDEAGEAANLAFTYAQIPSLGIGLIVVAGAVLGPKDWTLSWPRYLVRAWRRGRRAGCLAGAPYEEMLSLPLAEARRRLGIEPPEIAHPEGIVVGSHLSISDPASDPDAGGRSGQEAVA